MSQRQSPEYKAALAQLDQLVALKPVRTSPPSLATPKLRYNADSRPGMTVYFSAHKSHDPAVGTWVSMAYPGRNYVDPPIEVLQQIIKQLTP